MKIEFEMDGGFAAVPGLNKSLIIDTDHLAVTEARELEQIIGAANLFALPTMAVSPTLGQADARHYTITIDDQGSHRTVQVMDPIADAGVQALVQYLRAKIRVSLASS